MQTASTLENDGYNSDNELGTLPDSLSSGFDDDELNNDDDMQFKLDTLAVYTQFKSSGELNPN